MKRLFLALVLALLAPFALANGEYLEAFMSHYQIKEGSVIAEKSCGVCHISDSDFGFNPYGRDLKKALADHGSKVVNEDILKSIEDKDSDEDGTPNGQEIKAGTLPGDPASGGVPGAKPTTASTTTAKKPVHFPPKNGFHPAIVHFPIALFIGGLVLDFLGMIRRDKTLLHAGFYSIAMAVITSLGGIASGAFAMYLQKLPYRGLIFTHIILALVSSGLMGLMLAMRVHRHEKMHLPTRVIYYLCAIACFVLISYAGHLGGEFVYGE
jgi:uncharacterized membrane protein